MTQVAWQCFRVWENKNGYPPKETHPVAGVFWPFLRRRARTSARDRASPGGEGREAFPRHQGRRKRTDLFFDRVFLGVTAESQGFLCHGCCWETFVTFFAYCGLVVEIQPRNCHVFQVLLFFQRQPSCGDGLAARMQANRNGENRAWGWKNGGSHVGPDGEVVAWLD